jgi:hypothetical protein
MTAEGVAYTWRQLAARAGIPARAQADTGFEELGIPVAYARPEQVHLDRPGIIVVPGSCSAWRQLLERQPLSLPWIPAHRTVPPGSESPFPDAVPVLFCGDARGWDNKAWFQVDRNGNLVFWVDIIAASFFMLSRWEETVASTHDEHERFPATASVAYKQGFLDRPVVDEYALILREWLKVLVPGWDPKPRAFSVFLSHDVDSIRLLRQWLPAAMTLGGDLVKRRSLMTAWRTASGWALPGRDPYFQGIQALARVSEENGLGGDVYNFMASKPSSMDNDYDLAWPRVTKCLQGLRERGFEIGFHASYHTLNDPGRLALEKARFEALTGETRAGGRQHFLRFQVPETWRHWEQVGLSYDSTMAYADCEGFRCGTCHPFRPFDVKQDREMALWEQPLIAMDNTLQGYRALTPEQGRARILELARRCRRVEGTFTLLWHNTSLVGDWRPWWDVYQRVVRALAEMQGAPSEQTAIAGQEAVS